MDKIVFIGPGRTGLALGYAFAHEDEGVRVSYLGRRPEPPEHPIFHEGLASYSYGVERPEAGTTAVFLTVPDGALPEMAAVLAERGAAPDGCSVFHCSGALAADPLAPLHAQGYRVGTFHPLQAIAGAGSPERFREGFFAISGEAEALATARRLVSVLGARAISVPAGKRPLYHAAAVMASNYVVVLLHEAIRLFERVGASPEESRAAIASLARGAVENVARLGPDHALTGPLLRGDADTLALHLRALDPDEARLYAVLGRRGLDWVGERLPERAGAEISDLLDRYT